MTTLNVSSLFGQMRISTFTSPDSRSISTKRLKKPYLETSQSCMTPWRWRSQGAKMFDNESDEDERLIAREHKGTVATFSLLDSRSFFSLSSHSTQSTMWVNSCPSFRWQWRRARCTVDLVNELNRAIRAFRSIFQRQRPRRSNWRSKPKRGTRHIGHIC